MCIAFNCSAPSPEGKYCALHEKHYSKSSAPVSAPKPIPKQTKKTKSLNAKLKELYPIFLKDKNFMCEVKTSVCTRTAEVVHHTEGRGKDVILDQKTWKASCIACNSRIESHPEEGAPGSKVSRHKNKDNE